MAIHEFEFVKAFPAYCASKNAGTLLVQMYAQTISPDDMQILSFHPGGIYTDGVKKSGVPEEAMAWDDGMSISSELPSSFLREILQRC